MIHFEAFQMRGGESRQAWVILNINLLCFFDPHWTPVVVDLAKGRRVKHGEAGTFVQFFYPQLGMFTSPEEQPGQMFDPLKMEWVRMDDLPPARLWGARQNLRRPIHTMEQVFFRQLCKVTRLKNTHFVAAPKCPAVCYVGTLKGPIVRYAFTGTAEAAASTLRKVQTVSMPATVVSVVTSFLGVPLDATAAALNRQALPELQDEQVRRVAKRKREACDRRRQTMKKPRRTDARLTRVRAKVSTYRRVMAHLDTCDMDRHLKALAAMKTSGGRHMFSTKMLEQKRTTFLAHRENATMMLQAAERALSRLDATANGEDWESD